MNYGPQPAEVVDFVKQNAVAVVRGNHDHAVGFSEDPRCTPRYHEMAETTMKVSDAVLTAAHKEYLRSLPLGMDLVRDGVRFHLCHAIPSNPLYGYCPEESDRWLTELEQANCDVLLVGHTHTPFIRPFGTQKVANPGSLGQPKTGRPDACYAIWDGSSFQLRSFSYPVDNTVTRIRQMPVPDSVKSDLIRVLQTGTV